MSFSRLWVVGLGRLFSIRKSYFSQVKSLILVGTLEKYQFLILIIPKAFLICGLVTVPPGPP
ncbi:hypothetical protein BUQ74_16845 [Leptospira weilii serovar Heyan]|nr:hypothetical protein BUQ74_16845 [Leptospira weilii serovar Heyan]